MLRLWLLTVLVVDELYDDKGGHDEFDDVVDAVDAVGESVDGEEEVVAAWWVKTTPNPEASPATASIPPTRAYVDHDLNIFEKESSHDEDSDADDEEGELVSTFDGVEAAERVSFDGDNEDGPKSIF